MPTEATPVITPSNVQTEVLDTNGKSFPAHSPLSDIFDKIEGGQKASEAIKEVMVEKPAPTPVVEVKPAPEPKPEPKPAPEPKPEPATGLDAQLVANEAKKDEAAKKLADIKPDPDAITDDDLKVLPHDKPKTAKRIQTLLSKIDEANKAVVTTRKEADDRATKLRELEGKLADVKTVDPMTDDRVKKSLEELSMYRRRYELDNDPAVKAKFDDRVSSLDKQIPDILKRNQAGEGLLKLIDEEGGWLKFSQSQRQVPLDDGKVVSAAMLADMIASALPFADRRAVDSLTMEELTTKRERERYFQEEQKTATAYFKKRDEEASKSGEAYQNQIKEAQATINKFQKETMDQTDWLKEKPVPSDATPEQKTAIEEDNKAAKEFAGKLATSLSVKDIPSMLAIVRDSVHFYQQQRENTRLVTENKSLKAAVTSKQEELDRFKSAGRSTPRGGSIASGSSAAQVKDEKPKSLEDAFDAIETGKRE